MTLAAILSHLAPSKHSTYRYYSQTRCTGTLKAFHLLPLTVTRIPVMPDLTEAYTWPNGMTELVDRDSIHECWSRGTETNYAK